MDLDTDLGMNTGLQLSTWDNTCMVAASSSLWHGVFSSENWKMEGMVNNTEMILSSIC